MGSRDAWRPDPELQRRYEYFGEMTVVLQGQYRRIEENYSSSTDWTRPDSYYSDSSNKGDCFDSYETKAIESKDFLGKGHYYLSSYLPVLQTRINKTSSLTDYYEEARKIWYCTCPRD